MKKLLALVLALVMSMSLVTISNAAFSDADKISHDEAVDVLNTLGVINGMPDGSYNPAGNVTRAEMAKMISIIMLGDVDASAFVGTATGLTDIKGHWAEGYIQYCYSQGIIAGRGDGTFAPNANVTAVEAAKMLLGAIGYNATVQGYVGSDWAINVTRDAQLSGFYTDLKGLSSTKALNRDEAAQMIYNAVVAKLIVKEPSLNINTGSITYNYTPSNTKSLLTETFGAVKVEGVVTANQFTDNDLKDKTTVAITNSDELSQAGYAFSASSNFKTVSGAEVYGRAISLYVKPSTAAKNNTLKATVLGSAFVNDTNTVVTTTAKTDKDKTIADLAKDNGLKLDTTATSGQYFDKDKTTYVVNYVPQATALTTAVNGQQTVLIDNDGDGKVEVVLQNTYTFGKVSTYSTANDGKLILQYNGGTLTETKANENVVGMKDIAKDDIVNFIKVDDTIYVAKAQTVSGKMSAFKAATNVVVGGETYKLSGGTTYSNGGKFVAQTAVAATSYVDKEMTLYLDQFGYVIAAEAAAAKSFLYVSNAASVGNDGSSMNSNSIVRAYVVLEDGTSASYIVDDVDTVDCTGVGSSANNVTIGAVYKYVIDSDGKLDLTSIDTSATFAAGKQTVTTANANFVFESGKSTVTADTSKTILADNSTLFIYITKNADGSKIKSMTSYVGKDKAPSVKATSENQVKSIVVANKDDAGLADLVVVETKATAASNFIYLYKYVQSAEKTVDYLAIVDGEVGKTVTIKSTDTKLSGVYEYTINADGQYELSGAPATTTTQHTKLVSGSAVVLKDNTEVSIKDAVVALIDGDDTAVGYTLNEKNDYVTVVYDSTTKVAKAVYVLEAYASDNANVLGIKAGATNAKVSATAGVAYDVKAGTASTVISDFVFSANVNTANVKFVAAEPADFEAAENAAAVTTLVDSTTYYMVVFSEDNTTATWYKVACKTSLT